jgi:hypothetical protein
MSEQRQKNRPEQGVVQAFPTEQLGRLRDRFLNVPLDSDLDEKLRFYSEAIRLKPDNVEALNNRGNARNDKGDLEGLLSEPRVMWRSHYRTKTRRSSSATNQRNEHPGSLSPACSESYTRAVRHASLWGNTVFSLHGSSGRSNQLPQPSNMAGFPRCLSSVEAR